MMKRYLWPAIAFLTAGCATTGAVYEIAGKEVFEGAFIVCKSDIKWNGTSILVEGIEADNQEKTDKYTIGKLEYKQTSLRQLDAISQSVDALFKQMCTSTVALRNDSDALKEYVSKRDETALKIIDMLTELEAINADDGLPEEKAVQKQGEAAKPALEEAIEQTKL